ncbi:MAG TPA: hypothetical protein VE525_17680 [Rubrobacter sp.]|nr:hypothetical protein [Rubrobacter sp.]
MPEEPLRHRHHGQSRQGTNRHEDQFVELGGPQDGVRDGPVLDKALGLQLHPVVGVGLGAVYADDGDVDDVRDAGH